MKKRKLKQGLIVSCQATIDEPMHGSDIMARMALAAEQGGASGVRVNTYNDLVAVRKAVDLPILGLIKHSYDGFYPYITPTIKEVDLVVKSGADIVCVDATNYPRPDGLELAEFVKQIRTKYPDIQLLADVSTLEEGVYASEIGFDYVATTLAGYTPDTIDNNAEIIQELRPPYFDLISALYDKIDKPIIAEGRFFDGPNAVKAMKMGAYGVTIGAGITRPQIITKKIVDEISENGPYE